MLNVFVFVLAIVGIMLARGRRMLDGTRLPPTRDRAIVSAVMLVTGGVIMLGELLVSLSRRG
jgi:hypothetical protein